MKSGMAFLRTENSECLRTQLGSLITPFRPFPDRDRHLDGSRHFRRAFRFSRAIAQTPAKQGHLSRGSASNSQASLQGASSCQYFSIRSLILAYALSQCIGQDETSN